MKDILILNFSGLIYFLFPYVLGFYSKLLKHILLNLNPVQKGCQYKNYNLSVLLLEWTKVKIPIELSEAINKYLLLISIIFSFIFFNTSYSFFT